MARYRTSYHVHAHRQLDDPEVVVARLTKTWWRPLENARSRHVATAAMRLDSGAAEAVNVADLLRELADAAEGETYLL